MRPDGKTQRWIKSVPVPVTTLDALIGKYGAPAFIKIDVEGFEEEALQGLSFAVKALSFEFHDHSAPCRTRLHRPLHRAGLHAVQCRARREPGVCERRLGSAAKRSPRWLTGLPHAANSGDIYAAPRLNRAQPMRRRLYLAVRRADRRRPTV